MKFKRFSVRGVIAVEIRFGKMWLANAQRHLRMAEENLAEVRKWLGMYEAPSKEALLLMRESVKLRRDAWEQVRFYDGVLSGMRIMERAIRERVPIDVFDSLDEPEG